jgi:hypothetical protein
MKFDDNPSEDCCNVFLRGEGCREKMLLNFVIRFVKVAEQVMNVLSIHVGV